MLRIDYVNTAAAAAADVNQSPRRALVDDRSVRKRRRAASGEPGRCLADCRRPGARAGDEVWMAESCGD